MAVIATPPFLYFTDDDGNPLSGGKIYTYRAGTSQLKNTFTDSTENTPATNPIVLDSAGRAVVWISGSYKFVITDAFDNIIRTVDNVTSFNVFQNEADSFFESLSGDGVETTFSLSSDLGTDENAVFVFADNGMTNHVRNGTFDTDTIWTKGSGWSIGSGVATAAGAISTAIEQNSNITLNAGQAYVVTFTMTRDAGTLTASVGGTAGTARNAAGTYTEIIIAGSTQVLAFTGGGFTGTLDDVSIKPVMSSGANIIPPTQFTLSGTSITFANPPGVGTNNISIFAPSLLVASAAGSAAAAEQSADNAATSENNAAQSASDASDSADLAESWAIGDSSARPEGSAKAWAEAASATAIPNGSLTTAKYADESVTEPKLSDEAVSLRTLVAAVREGLATTGDVKHGYYSAAPSGWLELNGQTVSRTTYADLYAHINGLGLIVTEGTKAAHEWGDGDGSTTFSLPLFNDFIRAKGDSGRALGSLQTDAMQGHKHARDSDVDFFITNKTSGNSLSPTASGSDWGASTSTGSPITDGANGTPRTDSETRPRNITLMALVKT